MPGVWVGQRLDLDVISQAISPEQALRMVQDASAMTLQDDLERGAEPSARRAPEELWQLLSRIQHEGQQVHGISRDYLRGLCRCFQLPRDFFEA